MKNILYIISFSLLVLFPACSEFLDKMPDDQKTMDMVWASQKETEAYLYNIYAKLPDDRSIWNGVPWVAASDELDICWERYYCTNINVGSWNPTTNYHDVWGDYYKSIRASFVFENNVDRCAELSDDLKIQYKAEAKFLRGFYYWLLLRQYGPFVLLESETDQNDDWNTYPRTPYDDCVAYICRMMDEAQAGLPFSWKATDQKWMGKPDQMACKAVKVKALIMSASPQWNGNPDYANFKNHDGTPLVNTAYDENKWREAAAAAKAVIDAAENQSGGTIKLYRNDENGDATFNPFKSVQDVHLVKWNCEYLWGMTGNNFNNLEIHATPRPNCWNGLAPTQRIVDAFYMRDGKTTDDSELYKETGFAGSAHPNWTVDDVAEVRKRDNWGHRIGEHNMYADREARFYAFILYNGRPLPQTSNDSRNEYSTGNNKNGWGRVELYASGAAGSGAADHSTTGYLMLKFVNFDSDPRLRQHGPWRQTTYIRLADIYLDYIEALNEYDPSHADIKTYWDKIRARAGLPSIFDAYPGIAGDKNKQLEYILRERQVELCFEGDRYFTTRRRLLSDKTDTDRTSDKRRFGDNGPLYGLSILKGNSFTSTDFYERWPFETRVFDKKMYLFPITQYEMDRNKAMVQNPGW
ncbi:MAG: RagB/SusD family nutrient uptake outer membrane protein [Tannerella sp.]|nr:RagB/SusD family nutrient uptake outer membrane protein [Tannerella sp.]